MTIPRMAFAIGILAALGLSQAASAQEATSWNLYDSYTTSYTINYTKNSSLDPSGAALYVMASVAGGTPVEYQLDTGSQGMVLPQYLLPDFQQSSDLQKIEYGSSGNYALGTWTTQTVTFTDSNDGNGNLATAEVEVFVAAEYYDSANPGGVSCASADSGCAHMIGIGFGRPDTGWGPDYLPSLNNNPLLHLTGMDEGTVRAGYVITADGIQAGLTSANAGTGFAYVQLQPTTGATAPNWQTTAGSVVVNGTSSSSPILVDTGLQYMWADLGSSIAGQSVPCASNASFNCAPDGTQVSVYFGGTEGVGYSFVVGGTDNPPATPEFARLAGGGVNTGINVLASFTYVFDAVGGFVGYLANDPQGSGITFSPYLSAIGDFDMPSSFATNLPVYIAGDSVFSTPDNATFASAFTGIGGLTLDGPGGIIFQANMTLPAGITVSAGSATFQATVAAPLAVDAGASVSNLGTIVGNVTNAGTFANDGTVDGNFANTGVLSGNGTITGDLTTGGGVSPGHSVGMTSVQGNVAFQPGSYYVAELGAGGTSDLVQSGGQVFVDNATLYVAPTAEWKPGFASYQIISAAGGVVGNFDVVAPSFGAIDAPYPFLDVDTTADSDGLQLDIVRSGIAFASVTETANQTAAATALDSAAVGLNAQLVVLNAADARWAFDQLPGYVNASVKGLLVEQSGLIRGALDGRLRAAQGGVAASAAPVVGYALDGGADNLAAAPATTDGLAVWTTGFGSWGEMAGDDNAAGISGSTGGFLIGADTALGDSWRVGLAGGYSYTNFNLIDRNASGDSENWHLGIYGGRTWSGLPAGDIALRTGLAYTWQNVEANRSVAFSGYADQLAASYNAGTLQAFGELGWRLDTAVAALEPFANLAYVHLDDGGYTEDGGLAALSAPSSSMDTGFSTLGLRVSRKATLAALDATLRGEIGWRYAFGDITPMATQTFVGSDAFTVAGVPIAQNAAVLQAGLDVKLGQATTLGVAYAGQFGDGVTQNGFNANLKIEF
ncbi:autotransporter family protein [Kaistia algarum]|uniref:autotransporter family protein n=1 Tax=Kaistia algarum TaxID=2083279 RepID=UPI001403037B|nr:autotransporter domain-containing protein [Kaistia algarum]MCX5512328.1 autotransporter domain-containing protein [Kaistia algarum]